MSFINCSTRQDMLNHRDSLAVSFTSVKQSRLSGYHKSYIYLTNTYPVTLCHCGYKYPSIAKMRINACRNRYIMSLMYINVPSQKISNKNSIKKRDVQ